MILRMFFTYLVVTLAIIFGCAADLWAQAKNEVVIYDYQGVAEGITKRKFGMFQGILNAKIERLKRELPTEIDDVQHIADLSPTFQHKTTSMSTSGIHLWLKNRATALCLLTGTIASEDEKNYLVVSQVYLGELQEYLPFDPIIIPLPIKVSEFSNIQDSHSLVIFYALAMDAKRLGLDSHLIARFLAMAKEKLANIDARSDQLTADLQVLRKAIEKAESDLLGGLDDG